MNVVLTPAGRQYAETHPDSLVARTALAGYGQSWPAGHVTAAINACNDKAVHPRDRRWADGTDHGDNDQR